MIREIIVSNTVSGIFLIFCRSSFTNNFIVENNFSTLKSPKLIFRNISRTIYLKKISAHRFEHHVRSNKLQEFFFETIFRQGNGPFFATTKPLI